MASNLQPTPYDLADLLRMVDQGTLQLPEFQRPATWKRKDEEELLRTVARGWPCGAFLAYRGTAGLKYRVLEDAPTARGTRPEMLLLDGQQRLTALHRAYRDRGKRTYYVRIDAVVAEGEFLDEHLDSESTAAFTRKYDGLAANSKHGVVKISTIVDDIAWDEWLSFVPEKKARAALIAARASLVAGFRAYSLFVTVLPESTDLITVARIFETLNKTGMRLETFDLVVAKVYSRSFNLRDRWNDAVAKMPLFLDFKTSGLEALRLIALGEAIDPRSARSNVRGIRQDDVLRLDGGLITRDWAASVGAVGEAYNWAHERCGVKDGSFLPSVTMMLPIAHMFRHRKNWRAGMEKDLEHWFWSTAVEQSYSQGANTRAVTDARELLAWNTSRTAVPGVVTEASELDASEIKGRLLRPRARNEMLARAAFCALLAHGCQDWYAASSTLLAEKADLEIHHILPTAQKKKAGVQQEERIANLTPLLASTNQSIGSDPPSIVKKNQNIVRSAVESHGVSWDLYTNAAAASAANRLINARAETIARWLHERLPHHR